MASHHLSSCFLDLPVQKRMEYYFATGAAYCISDPLMRELEHFLRSVIHSPASLGRCHIALSLSLLPLLADRGPGKFQELSVQLGIPDDMLVGFIVGE